MKASNYLIQEGKVCDMWDLVPSMVHLNDVADTLSKINRFGGRTPYPYSVAQHAVLVSYLVPPEHAYEALHHDDTEAFVGDVLGPIKANLPWFKELEARVRRAVAYKFGLAECEPAAVKSADELALKIEQSLIQGRKDIVWSLPAGVARWQIDNLVTRMNTERAYISYMLRHKSLTGTTLWT